MMLTLIRSNLFFFLLLLYLSRAYQRLRDKLYRNYQDGRRSLAFQLECLQWRRHAGPSRTRTSLSRSRKLTRVVTLSWGPTPISEAPVLPSCRCMSCVVSVSVCRFRPLTIMSRASSRRQELIIRRRLADSTTLPFFDFFPFDFFSIFFSYYDYVFPFFPFSLLCNFLWHFFHISFSTFSYIQHSVKI